MNYISLILLQTNSLAETVLPVAGELVEKKEETLNFIDLAMKGGFIMIPIILLSFVAISIFVSKYFEISKASKSQDAFMNNIKELVENDDISGAMSLCRNNSHPIAKMVHKGLIHMGRPMSDIRETIENIGNQEVFILEKGLSAIGMVAGGAPMLGFLGTVLGMIDAFYSMAKAGSNIDISALSGGIYVAMVTTAAGLIVGLIGYFAYNVLASKIRKVVYNMETVTTDFMDILIKPIK